MKNRLAPSVRELRALLLATVIAGPSALAADTIFDYTGADQMYQVPAGVTAVQVYLWGAGGAAHPALAVDGGGGSFITGTLAVTPGEMLTIVVGGKGGVVGNNAAPGFGGGGTGGDSVNDGYAGGGRSAIRRGGVDVATAAGGGGAGNSGSALNFGGGGGLATGTTGGGSSSPGSGGTQSAGGTGGVGDAPDVVGQNGSLGQGGNGGSNGGRGGGGGGGGYYGGGGGAGSTFSDGGGGGGGSSLISGLTAAGGSEAATGRTPGGTASSFYVAGIGVGGQGGGASNLGGNGRIVISDQAILPAMATIIYERDDPAPGVPGAAFTKFGPPAISDAGVVSFAASWVIGRATGSGIFSDPTPDAVKDATLVVKVGDPVPGAGTGDLPADATFKTLRDPVPGPQSRIVFLATIKGAGVRPTNDAVVARWNGAALAFVAREGRQATDAPDGALWKSFTSVAYSTGSPLPMFVGTLLPGRGGVTAKNDSGLWAADSSGELRLLFREGFEPFTGAGRIVKTFNVLKTTVGSPGQTRSFNTSRTVVWHATFTDGTSGIVRTEVP